MRLARLAPAVPALIAASFVLTVYADTGDTLDALTRPLLVAIAVSVIIQLVMVVGTRDVVRGSVVASLTIPCLIDIRFAAVTVAAAVGFLVARATQRGTGGAQAALVVPVILFAISLGRVITGEAFALSDLLPGNTIVADERWEQTARPNIYVILLDGYPRSDTLESFGLDNRPFIRGLTERGFEVAPRSNGSYPLTAQVVTSMLQMAHLPDIDVLTPAPNTQAGQARAIAAAIRSNPAIEFLELRGYRTISTGFPASVITLRGVDKYLDPGAVTTFEHQVLRRSALWQWLDGPWALPQLQSQVVQTFDTVERVAATERADPVFLFAHVLSPHTPFVFDRDGKMPRLSCDPECERWTIYRERIPLPKDEYEAAYAEQVQYVNELTLNAVDAIIEADDEAVVIVFSDHGARADPAETDEWYRTLFAARTPGHPGLFGDDARAIEIFPRLLGAYFDARIAVPADVTYLADADAGLLYPLNLTLESSGPPD